MSTKRALLLVNMGGPASNADVAPYMRAIFADPYILPVPDFLRGFISNMIVRKRTESVIDKYNLIGGPSPLLKWTEKQTNLIRADLNEMYTRVTHCYRYTQPLIGEMMAELKRDGIDEVTLLPLFPHETRAMTGSIEVEAKRHAEELDMPLRVVPVWGLQQPIIDLQATYLAKAMEEAGEGACVLFVAHGIPMRDVNRGDTYPHQVRENAERLAATLHEGTDWRLAYQSRVGPVKWTGPYLEDEVNNLAESHDPVVIMPLSFVADCLETMYDLDLVAGPDLLERGVRKVVRVSAYNDDPRFAKTLMQVVGELMDE